MKTLSLFPTVAMLEEIENKYGDVVSLVDMNGSAPLSLHAPPAAGGVSADASGAFEITFIHCPPSNAMLRFWTFREMIHFPHV